MNLILFGFKGCGKTTYGRKLSAHLNLAFIDTDQLIESTYQMSCHALYQQQGQHAFRKAESEVTRSLHKVTNSIIAVGGGLVLCQENVHFLQKQGILIYLTLDYQTLKQRMLDHPLPAYLDGHDKEGSFHQMYVERVSIYQNIKAAALPLTNKTEDEILDELSVLYYNHLKNWEHHGK